MSLIGKNIRKIRSVKKLSQSAFADLFSLSRTSVGAYEEERAEPKIDTIIQMANYFGVSVDGLLTKELTVNELFHFDIFKKDIVEKALNKPSQEVKHENSISLVSIKEGVSYVDQGGNADFIQGLSSLSLPGLSGKEYRAFELKGSELASGNAGLVNGDILVAKSVGIRSLEVGGLYVVVTSNRLIIRRLDSKTKVLVLSADSSNYEDLVVEKSEIQELWEVKGYYSTNLTVPELLESRVAKLEKQVANLLKRK